MNVFRRLRSCLALALVLGLSGCGLISGIPSQDNPSCSWTTEPPRNQETVCRTVYRTLKLLTAAERTGDDATIHRLVTKPIVAERIIVYGREKRQDDLRMLRPTPSLTLGASANHTLGVGLQIVGSSSKGNFAAAETIYVRIQGGTAYVVDDQPVQEW